MFAVILAVWRTYHGVLLFVLPTDMAHGSGARPKVKEAEGSYCYALAEGLAAEFERAAETKARTGTGTQYPIRKQRRWLTLW